MCIGFISDYCFYITKSARHNQPIRALTQQKKDLQTKSCDLCQQVFFFLLTFLTPSTASA